MVGVTPRYLMSHWRELALVYSVLVPPSSSVPKFFPGTKAITAWPRSHNSPAPQPFRHKTGDYGVCQVDQTHKPLEKGADWTAVAVVPSPGLQARRKCGIMTDRAFNAFYDLITKDLEATISVHNLYKT